MAIIPELLKAKRFDEAKAEIDRASSWDRTTRGQMKLLRQWKGELGGADRLKAERQTQLTEDPYKIASEQFNQGNYSEAQTIVDRWLVDDPQNAQARVLQAKIKQASGIKRAYEVHMKGKMYDQALEASAAGKINPEDPNLSQMRLAATNRKLSAVATLSVQRLG